MSAVKTIDTFPVIFFDTTCYYFFPYNVFLGLCWLCGLSRLAVLPGSDIGNNNLSNHNKENTMTKSSGTYRICVENYGVVTLITNNK